LPACLEAEDLAFDDQQFEAEKRLFSDLLEVGQRLSLIEHRVAKIDQTYHLAAHDERQDQDIFGKWFAEEIEQFEVRAAHAKRPTETVLACEDSF